MKTIPLKAHATNPEMTTKNLIKHITNNPPPAGFTVEDIVARLRIHKAVDALAEGSTVLELEDADHAILAKAAGEQRWTAVDEFIPDFVTSIKNA